MSNISFRAIKETTSMKGIFHNIKDHQDWVTSIVGKKITENIYWKVSSYNTEILGVKKKNAKSLQKEKGRGKYHIIKIGNSNEIRFFNNHTRN